jgi:hypothetical protein
MLKPLLSALALAAAVTFAWAAGAGEEWGIEYEEKARFEAKVVDIACELTGDCPANCGGGKRQLGLLRNDGKLILPIKNNDPFAGTIVDLLPYCGKRITADGLWIPNPKLPMFVLQFKRPAPAGKWSRANLFVKEWGKKFGAGKQGKWFRHDPRITKAIAADGVFGIPGLKPAQE